MPSSYTIRGDVVWPARLIQPARPPALVYLDMNHYINLAKVKVGTAPQGYPELLEACRRTRADARALFPLSLTHIVEISNIGSFQQREDVVAVMEELSDFNYLLGRVQIMQLEIEATVDMMLGRDDSVGAGISLIGLSALWAFGMRGGLILDGEGSAQEAEQRLRYRLGDEKFERMMAHFNQEAEHALLTGPDEDTKAELRRDGYAPELPYQQHEQRAQQERAHTAVLDQNPELRRGQLRDFLSMEEVVIDLNEIIARELAVRNVTKAEFLALLGDGEDHSKARAFTDGMPSTRVAISLKEYYHRDRQHNWTSNDIHDIDALAVAMPYCDAVFTDAAAWNALKNSQGLNVFDTFLPRRPDHLTHWLDSLQRA